MELISDDEGITVEQAAEQLEASMPEPTNTAPRVSPEDRAREHAQAIADMGIDVEYDGAPVKPTHRRGSVDEAAARLEGNNAEVPIEKPAPVQPQAQPLPQPVSTAEQLRQVAATVEARASQIDWQRLRKVDPGEYAAQRQEYLDAKAWLRDQSLALSANEQQSAAQAQAQYQQQVQQYVAHAHQELHRLIPEWNDQSVKEKEGKRLVDYMQRNGYTAQEIANLYDPKAIAMARKAMITEQRARQRRRKKSEVNPIQNEIQRRNLNPHGLEVAALRYQAMHS